MKHIELLGIPGSGKTTVASYLQSTYSQVYSLSDSFKQALFDLLLNGRLGSIHSKIPIKFLEFTSRMTGVTDWCFNDFLIKNPNVFYSIDMKRFTDDIDRINSVANGLNSLIEKYNVTSQFWKKDQPVLIEEGFAHRAGSVFVHPRQKSRASMEHIKEYSKAVPMPDEILYLQIDPVTAEERMKSRKTAYPESYSSFSKDEMIHKLKQIDICLSTIVKVLTEEDTNVVRVNAKRSPKDILSVYQSNTSILTEPSRI